MSGTASVTNEFQNRTPSIPLADLDENFTDLTDYLNDPTNRYNFAVAGGAANTYSVTLSPPATGYTVGMEISFKAANTNTGSSVVNVNGLGNKSIVTITGAAVGAGQVQRIAKAIYDGTAFVLISADTSGGAGSTSSVGIFLRQDGTTPLLGPWSVNDQQVNSAEFYDYGLKKSIYTQSSAVITFDYSAAQFYECTLNQTATAVVISNPPASGTYGEIGVKWIQAGTATFSIAYSSAYKFPGGATHTVSTTTSAIDIASYKTDNAGTTWFCDYSKAYG